MDGLGRRILQLGRPIIDESHGPQEGEQNLSLQRFNYKPVTVLTDQRLRSRQFQLAWNAYGLVPAVAKESDGSGFSGLGLCIGHGLCY